MGYTEAEYQRSRECIIRECLDVDAGVVIVADHEPLKSIPYKPTGDQPAAIADLVKDFQEGNQFQTLLGVTGSGNGSYLLTPVCCRFLSIFMSI